MLMNIILAISFYPVMLFIYCLMRRYTKKQNGLTFGIHLPRNEKTEDRVKEAEAVYQKQLNRIFIISMIIPVSAFFVSHVSVQFTIWITWFMAALVALMLPYVRAFDKMLALKNRLKAENSFEMSNSDTESDNGAYCRYAELTQVRKVRFAAFLPPILIGLASGIPLLWMEECCITYSAATIILAAATILFFGMAKWTDSFSGNVISEDSSINTAYSRARKNIWKNIWLGEAWVNTLEVVLLSGSVYFHVESFGFMIWSIIIESILAVGIMFVGMRHNADVERIYQPRRDAKFEEDDDIYWKWGIFYNNPLDKRNLVDKRFGTGLTTNMARPIGRVCLWIVILVLVWIPVVCAWLIFEDFTPISVRVEDNTVICEHLKQEYSIPVEDISRIELVDSLPRNRIKSNGTATDTLEKGRFRCSEHGGYYEFLNPGNDTFILMEAGSKIYYISDEDDAGTLLVWDELHGELNR